MLTTNRKLIEDFFIEHAPQHICLGFQALEMVEALFTAADQGGFRLLVPATPQIMKELESRAVEALSLAMFHRPVIDVLLVPQSDPFEERWQRQDIFGTSLVNDAEAALNMDAAAELRRCLRDALSAPLWSAIALSMDCDPEAGIIHRVIVDVVYAMLAFAAAGDSDKVKRLAPLAALCRNAVPVCEFEPGSWLLRYGNPHEVEVIEGMEIIESAPDRAAQAAP